MPLIFLAPLAFIGLAAAGVIVSAIRRGRRARSGYRYPGAPMDPNANTPLLLQSELLQSELNRSAQDTPGHHDQRHHSHHHLHHHEPSSGPGFSSADPGNPGGAPHHHHG